VGVVSAVGVRVCGAAKVRRPEDVAVGCAPAVAVDDAGKPGIGRQAVSSRMQVIGKTTKRLFIFYSPLCRSNQLVSPPSLFSFTQGLNRGL
jgi:hypothetical protein